MHLNNDFSDHLPILLPPTEKHSQWRKIQRHRFENFWTLDDGCANIVENAWSLPRSPNPTSRCMEKMASQMELQYLCEYPKRNQETSNLDSIKANASDKNASLRR